MSEPNKPFWHFDGTISVAVIIMLVVQTGGLVWWASDISSRLAQLERTEAQRLSQGDRLTRVEEKLTAQSEVLNEIRDELKNNRRR